LTCGPLATPRYNIMLDRRFEHTGIHYIMTNLLSLVVSTSLLGLQDHTTHENMVLSLVLVFEVGVACVDIQPADHDQEVFKSCEWIYKSYFRVDIP